MMFFFFFFFFSSRRRHTRSLRDWSSDVCSSDLLWLRVAGQPQTCSGSRAGCALECRRHAHHCKERGATMRAHRCSVLDVGRSALSVGRFLSVGADDLHLVPEPLLVPMRPHAFAALVLGNFCFSSFLRRAI